MQRFKSDGAIEELAELEVVPDLGDFTLLGKADNLTFSSHAWTITIDPVSGISLNYGI